MKQYQKKSAMIIIRGIVLMLLGIFFIVGGYVTEINGVMYFGIVWTVLYGAVYIWNITRVVKILRAAAAFEKSGDANGVPPLPKTPLLDKYNEVQQFGDVGEVRFVNSGLKFSAKGKYACVKDFNGIPGYHFAFQITGEELVEKPDGYDDTLHYDECLFKIELAYFDGVKLSEPENDRGIVLDDIANLQGKTIKFSQSDEYIAQVVTVESDDVDCGEITFEEWSDTARVIRFKLLASCGIAEVIVGKVDLSEDNA